MPEAFEIAPLRPEGYQPLLADNELEQGESYEPKQLDLSPTFSERISSFSGSVSLPAMRGPTLQLVRSSLKAAAWFFVPTFLFLHKQPSRRIRNTSGLDGLRGLACLSVMVFHFMNSQTATLRGWMPSDKNSQTWWNLPIIKAFYSGTAMVFVFFVISGYVLSYRSIKHIRHKNWEGVLFGLGSSVFRRSIRLFGPCTIVMFIESVAIQLGAFEPARQYGNLVPNESALWPPLKKTWGEQMSMWWGLVIGLSNPFTWNEYDPRLLNHVLWTIPQEFRSSMALYLVIIGMCRVRPGMTRKALQVAFIAYCFKFGRWDMILFLSGMLSAEFDIPEGDVEHYEGPPKKQSLKKHLIWVGVIILGLFFISSPHDAPERAWGFIHVTRFARLVYFEVWKFSQSLGAILLVIAATRSELLQRLLNSKIVQYLGDISYSIYLVHGPLVRCVGVFVSGSVWTAAGGKDKAYGLGVGLSFLCYFTVVMVFADITWRMIDTPCVKFAKWFESLFFSR